MYQPKRLLVNAAPDTAGFLSELNLALREVANSLLDAGVQIDLSNAAIATKITIPTGSVYGDILYRGPTSWTRLPGGATAGRSLLTQGVNFPPIWGQVDHADLTNLEWSVAGHTMDANLDMGGNSIVNVTGLLTNPLTAQLDFATFGGTQVGDLASVTSVFGTGLQVGKTAGAYLDFMGAGSWDVDLMGSKGIGTPAVGGAGESLTFTGAGAITVVGDMSSVYNLWLGGSPSAVGIASGARFEWTAGQQYIDLKGADLQMDDGKFVGISAGVQILFDGTSSELELKGGDVVLDDTKSIGLGAGAGHITFTAGTLDLVTVENAKLVATSAPATIGTIDASTQFDDGTNALDVRVFGILRALYLQLGSTGGYFDYSAGECYWDDANHTLHVWDYTNNADRTVQLT